VENRAHLLAEGVFLGSDAGVVVIKGLFEYFGCETELLRQSCAVVKSLHESTADVMLAVPFDFLRGSAVENKTDWIL
jgi:hypothetical protein